MTEKRKETNMTSTGFAQTFSDYSNYDFGRVSTKNVSLEDITITHDNIPEFLFSPLDQIEKDLLASGHSRKEVKSVMVGLSQLPEYATSKRNSTRTKPN